jgi:glycosyltransferase involved in cell wall biosynthesis
VTIAVLARLVPIKGVDVALWALASLPARFRMVVAGDGPERARLMTLARELGVEDRVAWRGWLDASARDRVLVDADVVAVPSIVTPDGRHEGTPLAALEALACGVPVVATATGGLAALAASGARIVAPRDPRALATAIARVATLPIAPASALAWPAVGARLDEHWRRQVRS